MPGDDQRRIDLLIKLTGEQQKEIDALRGMIDHLISTTGRHTAEVEIFKSFITGLGRYLVLSKTVPPDMPDIVVSTSLTDLEAETASNGRELLEIFEFWASQDAQ